MLRLLAFALSLPIVFSTAVSVRAAHGRAAPHASTDPPAKFLVLFVLDGARPDYFGVTPLPNVDALIKNGTEYSYAMDGILESETPAGHTTLSTGSTPRRDGILGFNWAENDRNYSLFNPDVVRAGAIEQIMRNAHVPTLAGLFKAQHPKEKVVALSGHKYYAADPLGGPQADAIMYFRGDQNKGYSPTSIPGHVPPVGVLEAPGLSLPTFHLQDGQDDHLATLLALSAFRKMYPHVLLINYPEFDWPLGHVYGGSLNKPKVELLMKQFDEDLGQIETVYHQAHILKRTLFVITADHGMGKIKHFVPSRIMTDAVAHAGTTAPSIAYNGGAYLWVKNFTKAALVASNIVRAHDPGVQSVYYLAALGKTYRYVRSGGSAISRAVEAANQYLLSTLMNQHAPTVVVLCKANATTSPTSSHWLGDHGGANWRSQHIPLVLSGAGIRSGFVTGEPAQLEDVAPTVLRDMGVAPTGMEGHVLNEALLQPQAADWQPRVAEATTLTPLIKAMVAQSAYETTH